VAPDVLLVLQERDECEPILRALPDPARPAVVRLPAARYPRRTAVARRLARERSLAAHLAGAVPITLDLGRVPARAAPRGRGLAVIAACRALVGLDGRDGATLGLGWIGGVDAARARLTVHTSVAADRVAAVAIGRVRYHAA
jgi:polynucleotide 5'-kinase involved in rRNA processing